LLTDNMSRLERISKYLPQHETIDEQQVPEVFDAIPPDGDMSPAPMPAD
jgi:ATP-dependent Zn protease